MDELETWLQAMNTLTGGCELSMRAVLGGGLHVGLKWEQDSRAMEFWLTISGKEIENTNAAYQMLALEKIKHHVVDMLTQSIGQALKPL